MRPGSNSYHILIDEEVPVTNSKPLNGDDSIRKYQIKSIAARSFNNLVEITLCSLLLFIFVVILFVDLYEDSFIHWAKH